MLGVKEDAFTPGGKSPPVPTGRGWVSTRTSKNVFEKTKSLQPMRTYSNEGQLLLENYCQTEASTATFRTALYLPRNGQTAIFLSRDPSHATGY
jgi:hypothetical protein